MADANNTKWQVYRPEWYNNRILETYISSPTIDKQNDKIGTDTIKESMDFYMKYGVYSYKHEEMPVGLPLAYKVKDGKVKIRVGIHDKLPMHTRVWDEMKIYGDKGGSSIRGEAEKQEKICEGEVCHNNISELSLWSVSWVGNKPANPEATVTAVAAAKEEPEPIKLTKQITLDDVQGMVDNALEKKLGRRGSQWCILHHRTPGKIGQPIKGACHPTRRLAERQHAAMNARRFGKARKAIDDILNRFNPQTKAEYQGRKVELNKPFRLSNQNKKFGVYAKNEKGNTVQVKFGDPKMDIKRDSPEKRRNFRARHNCDSPGPKHKAKYWSCKMWSTSSVTDILGKIDKHIWDIAGIRKCKVQKGIDKISKAPRTGRTQRGMRAFMTACVANAKIHLRNYEGLQNVKKPRAFCAELWRDSGSFPGRGPKMSPSRVRDQSGQKFRRAMANRGWKPGERLRRGKTPSWNKKR